jgi:hypothetical protein
VRKYVCVSVTVRENVAGKPACAQPVARDQIERERERERERTREVGSSKTSVRAFASFAGARCGVGLLTLRFAGGGFLTKFSSKTGSPFQPMRTFISRPGG